MSKRWGAVVRGHDYDLQDWREMLKPPFDPWVEVHGSETVLLSASLDDLTSASEVSFRVVAHIDRLNGAMLVMRQSQPLQFSSVVEFAQDGALHRTVFLVGRRQKARNRVQAAIVVTGPGTVSPNHRLLQSQAKSNNGRPSQTTMTFWKMRLSTSDGCRHQTSRIHQRFGSTSTRRLSALR